VAGEEEQVAMKRNMVPLLGIAFVVAIISTGVFYGLFAGKLRSSNELPGHAIVVAARDLDRGTVLQPADLRVSAVQGVLEGSFSKPAEAAGATLLTSIKADEPLLQERVAPRVTEAPGGRVPTGMRAISLHVFQSESVLSLLRPGSRVDVQAVTERNGSTELRTVLENVQILAVSAADANGNRPSGAAVTVLIRAEDSDMVALADSGSRIRVALRNPLDQGITPSHALTLAGLFTGGTPKIDSPESAQASRAIWRHPIQMRVRVLNVSDLALAQLQAQMLNNAPGDSVKLSAFRSSDDAWKLIESLEQKHELEIVSSERLMAGVGRPISYHAGIKPYALGVQFSPEWAPSGKLGLRVRPQLGLPSGSAVTTEKFDAGLAVSSSFLIQGLLNGPAGQGFAEQLFPGRSWENKHLVIYVSTLIIQQTSPVAVARGGRRR
jgi:Flp pilus assembly protein CpaB